MVKIQFVTLTKSFKGNITFQMDLAERIINVSVFLKGRGPENLMCPYPMAPKILYMHII